MGYVPVMLLINISMFYEDQALLLIRRIQPDLVGSMEKTVEFICKFSPHPTDARLYCRFADPLSPSDFCRSIAANEIGQGASCL